MTNTLIYIGFYVSLDEKLVKESRTYSSAAVNLMNYISNELSERFQLLIISPSWSIKQSGFYSPKKISLTKNINLELPPSIGSKIYLIKLLSKILSQLWLFQRIIFTVRKNESVLVYHSIANSPAILCAKKLIGFKLILQLNEIYQDVKSLGLINNYLENLIIDSADAYILSTKLLESRVSKFNRKITICEGVAKMNSIKEEKKSDGKIHLVYAGLIDKEKLCAFNTIDIAPYLSDQYIIHIIGFGNKSDIDELLDRIKENNLKNSCKIYYDGFLEGEHLFLFLQQCHIGLVAQSEDKKFTQTSFPSKIYTYLTNNLVVVCLENNLILSSPVFNLLYTYKYNNPKMIANVVKEIDLNINYGKLYSETLTLIQNKIKKDLFEFF